jgi:hypothetical protein
MKRARRSHDPTLKEQIGLAALKGDKPLAELAD